ITCPSSRQRQRHEEGRQGTGTRCADWSPNRHACLSPSFYFFPPPAVITLDKETAHPLLILSKDCKSVTLGNEAPCFAKTHKRFDMSHSVLGCEEFKEGRSYWDISMGKEGDWTVGVARKSVRRKNAISIEPRSGIWAIGKRGNDYFAFDAPNCSRLQLTGELKRIRVFLNYAGKHVSFFDADEANILHHTYTSTISKEAFVPFFHLSHKHPEGSCDPLF
uniref:B30.2/SPRY domain-containing protein n=1 Tax=Laticauda laticaudata TaxID=8630 RepID=A0A8C5SFQ0_LATLA